MQPLGLCCVTGKKSSKTVFFVRATLILGNGFDTGVLWVNKLRHNLVTLVLIAGLAACGKNHSGGEQVSAPAESTAGATAEADLITSTDEFTVLAHDMGPRDELPGKVLYETHCASCHNGGVTKAPHLTFLEMLNPVAIVSAMNDGIMRTQAAALTQSERVHVAEYITQVPLAAAAANLKYAPACTDQSLDAAAGVVAAGWGHDTSRYSDAATAGFSAADAPDLTLQWAYAFPGALRARSNPSVGFGGLFVGSQDGTVYSFDLASGCEHWRWQASAEVRTGIVLAPANGERPPLALFGDILARLYAVNALTGELVWSFKVDDHPSATLTATPAVAGERLIVNVSSLEVTAAADPNYACCTFRGQTLAVDLEDGKVAWQHYAIPEPPAKVAQTRVGTAVMAPSGAPIWASPTIDTQRQRIYVGTGENYSSPADGNSDAVIAIDLETGERLWERQTFAGDAWNVACMFADNPNCPEENGPDLDHGSSILLVDIGEDRQMLVAGLKDGNVIGLDPDDNGKLRWRSKVGRGSIQGGVHFGLAAAGSTVYVPINDMDDRSGREQPDTPPKPGVSALNAATGGLRWQHVQENVCPETLTYCDPGVSAPVTAIPGGVVVGHLDGFLRIYAEEDGRVLWEYDTKQPVMAVNGLLASGGGMSGAGPIVANGYLIANSGYNLYFHEAGNMLAVFAPEAASGAD